ncbi:hypothetical protein BKA66DRAFT_420472 [Pyrenochaeta sp. MPI-SDFR-AT-0127]|nr:hypothetical protein BKA66DRAFT_420472 [Pyrenochaeta sp. MPI-SDFR-AT-0127]
MGPPLPQKLRGTCATLSALSILTIALRSYIMHMWYTGTLLTGIHYGTGQRTADISVTDSVHAMRCWWLCFLAYASTITFAKISAGFFFLRIAGVMTLHRIATYIVTLLAAVVGFAFFFVSLFQCSPIEFFWTRLQGASGKCISIDIIINFTYLYGSVAAVTDIALGFLVFALIWNLKIDQRTKMLISPFLAMACIASYAAIIRMPYIQNFKQADFLYATVDISLWSTVEVGVSIFAANLATLRPLIQRITKGAESSLSNRVPPNPAFEFQELSVIQIHIGSKEGPKSKGLVTERMDIEIEAGSTVSLTRSTRHRDRVS